jgi:hypothetical protein
MHPILEVLFRICEWPISASTRHLERIKIGQPDLEAHRGQDPALYQKANLAVYGLPGYPELLCDRALTNFTFSSLAQFSGHDAQDTQGGRVVA